MKTKCIYCNKEFEIREFPLSKLKQRKRPINYRIACSSKCSREYARIRTMFMARIAQRLKVKSIKEFKKLLSKHNI